MVPDEEAAKKVAAEIGLPVMIKAAEGGGGRGMRIVRNKRELIPAFQTARSEAEQAFGSANVYMEKLIERPRHIEFQVLGDLHGNVMHLGERECSLQRRHQKVLEESPSTVIDEATRQRIGKQVVEALRKIGYSSAGTVEFLRDESGNLYFIEMNARIQVEHPVTEMVTDIDLVKSQIRLAAGEKLKDVVGRWSSADMPSSAASTPRTRIRSLLRPGASRPFAFPAVREFAWTLPRTRTP